MDIHKQRVLLRSCISHVLLDNLFRITAKQLSFVMNIAASVVLQSCFSLTKELMLCVRNRICLICL